MTNHYHGSVLASVLLLIYVNSVYSSSVTNKTDTSRKMGEDLDVDYDRLLAAQEDDNVLIIDVRENAEIKETGKITGSIHIPMKEVMNELNLSSEEFETRYGKKKPSLGTEMIISCRSGRRSKAVQLDLHKAGYNNVFNYAGGWLDWNKHQKN